MSKKLTDVMIEKLRGPAVVWDASTTGLGIRATGRGKKVFVLQLRYPGLKAQSTRVIPQRVTPA